MPDESQIDGEYTVRRIKFQRGDGVDNRGEASYEQARETDPRAGRSEHTVELPDGTEVSATVSSTEFAEFVIEAERTLAVLENSLAITPDEE